MIQCYNQYMQQNQGNSQQIASINQVPSSHSLSADIATGWRPKVKVIGPMPLNFDNLWFDARIREVYASQASLFSIIYLGSRPLNSLAMHDYPTRQYKYKYEHLLNTNYTHLKAFFHKFYTQFQPQTKRPFVGMNPYIKDHSIIFDSHFQSGNLDCVVKVKDNQYDLVLRVDSNTAGHVQWYYFKLKNLLDSQRKVKINIVNFRKNKTCYERGMKPYIKRHGKHWDQGGINVETSLSTVKFGKQTINFNKETDLEDSPYLHKKLTFQINLDPNEQIQAAYSIPYTYTKLLNYLKQKKSNLPPTTVFDIDYSNESLSGLEIPILKITEATQEKSKKYSICLIGRQHPGQSNSSYVMEEIIDSLLQNNKQMIKIRQQCQFYIIPMLNPDGVVIGNFRTSLYGRDLNRLFRKKVSILTPEIQCAINTVQKIYKDFKKRFMLFLDIHGHSVRRNSFAYGPGIFDSKNIMDVRLFPKIISQSTQLFRYYSCTFRLQENKKLTARAVFGNYASICYTIQTSNWCYDVKGITSNFNSNSWKEVGYGISKGLANYISYKIQQKNKLLEKKKKKKKVIASDSTTSLSVDKTNLKKKKLIDGKIRLTTLNNSNQKNKVKNHISVKKSNNQQQQDKLQKNIQIPQEEAHQSDKFSQQGFDSENSQEDMDKIKYKNYISNASLMILQFKNVFYGSKDFKDIIKPKNQTKHIKPPSHNKSKKVINVLACLRKNISNSHSTNILQTKQFKQIEKKQIISALIKPKKQKNNNKDINHKDSTILPKIPNLINHYSQNEQNGFQQKLARMQAMAALRYQKKNEQL